MNTADAQAPDMDEHAANIDRRIGTHIVKRDKLVLLAQLIDRMIEYRNRAIRELGKQKSIELTFFLPGLDKGE